MLPSNHQQWGKMTPFMLHLCTYFIKTWNHFHFIDFNINFISLYAHWCSWCTIVPVSNVAPCPPLFTASRWARFHALVDWFFPPMFDIPGLNWNISVYWMDYRIISLVLFMLFLCYLCYFSNSFHILSIKYLGCILVLICSNRKVGTTRPQAWPHDDVIIRETPN